MVGTKNVHYLQCLSRLSIICALKLIYKFVKVASIESVPLQIQLEMRQTYNRS